jgi:hypothetical protein
MQDLCFSSTDVREIKRRNQRHVFYGGHGRHIPNFGRGIHLGHPCAHYVTLKKDLSKISCEDARWDELSQNWARVCGDAFYLSGAVFTSLCFQTHCCPSHLLCALKLSFCSQRNVAKRNLPASFVTSISPDKTKKHQTYLHDL